ncbi:FG-GAP-like repeat-containing protein [Adhaeribacter radiodurans]|uniref:T9SS type A sorting domain-containing protein n=1 Tax=Adhaeribacter radiodurans TaxID=2745197 RepID=A0A7L7LCX1_9BACT|nr:FG-GAP-like repeat-containing protein [Adhaeribacter radiodurans]QMU30597.1 T9SS type A sorting domain-containing protein [Adhaeribacter radiodurans]
MTRFLFGFLLIGFWAFHSQSFAQQYYEIRYQNNAKITVGAKIFNSPWAGGLNSAVFSKIDLNHDQTEDLFVFDRTQNKITTYLAKQVNGQWTWQHQPEYEVLFPDSLQDWVVLRDYNQDGRKDIFTKTNLGIKVYQNVTLPNGPLQFTLAEDFIRFNNGVNIQVSGDDLPGIQDLDNDGDLDILCFDFASGHTIQLYKNMQAEDKLATDSLRYKLDDSWWGKLTKCEDDCGHYVFNSACRTTGTKHSVPATILALDLDNDLDKDVLLGGDPCSELVRIMNQGTPAKAVMNSAGVQKAFPANTTPANFRQFLAAYYEDVTFDNVPDLLVSPYLPANVDGINTNQSVWLYRNTAAVNASPVFSFEQNNFLQDNMLDVGEDSAPAFADVDADGDLDLLIGKYATMRDDNSVSSLSLYENIGTSTEPHFSFKTDDYANLSALGLQGIKPRFADVNGDNALDLTFTVLNSSTGSNKYILNSAKAGQPFNFDVTKVQSLSIGENVGDVALFYDLDRDGDQDILIGASLPISETSGPLLFYRNTGTATKPVYTLANESFGNISYSEDAVRTLYPLIADLNNDNSPELITVDNRGVIKIYANFMADLNATFQETPALLANSISNQAVATRLGAHVALAAADLNGDRQPEIIAGNSGGGLFYLTQQLRNGTGLEDEKPTPTLAISVFPNPATQEVTVTGPEKMVVSLYSSEGRKVRSSGLSYAREHQFNVANLAAGLYYVQVQTAAGKTAGYRLLISQ